MGEFAIPTSEFKERIGKAQQFMAEEGLDALLTFSSECEPMHVRYFADYWANFETTKVFIPAKGDPMLIIGPESMTYARARSKIERIVRMQDSCESLQPEYPGVKLETWEQLFAEVPTRKLGVAGWDIIPHVVYMRIQEALGDAEIVEADGLMRRLMLKKAPAEIRCLREAARLSEVALQAVLDNIRPGLSEIQVVGIATGAMMAQGAEAQGYALWCSAGTHSIEAISRPTSRLLKEGEMIQIQVGAKVEGYSASIGRPVVLGHATDEMLRFMQVGCNAENTMVDLMRAGTPASEIAHRVHGYIRDEGYGDRILYGPGHSCGQMESELPYIETSSQYLLEENMTFHIDVFLASEEMGYRWEDCVVVRKDQPAEQLSSLRREVMVLPVSPA